MSITIMQSLTFVTFMVSEKIPMLDWETAVSIFLFLFRKKKIKPYQYDPWWFFTWGLLSLLLCEMRADSEKNCTNLACSQHESIFSTGPKFLWLGARCSIIGWCRGNTSLKQWKQNSWHNVAASINTWQDGLFVCWYFEPSQPQKII